ncbi:permease-like cell division protein FtsX [Calidifontibacillus erzurumensis]|uniref:Cell division protein FtsX n=1 Tax=Calidifontibacillus erzurumensis TaxID=2741433 RepID=A0A8J8KEG9_9BACI|nr:permease-like cell division protein FtsX [Calidifontibacillus erzurumensis]NSL51805.1 ABC transporter permease [Calidifontibacillus erzurumensis]
MTVNTMVRHLREGCKNIARNGWMTFASVSAVTVTLLLVGIFLVIMMNLNNFATTVEEDVEIRVHIDPIANEAQIKELGQRIKRISEVDQVAFSSKEQELEEIIKSFGEEGKAFESLKSENPLRDVYVVKTKDPQMTPAVAKKIEKFDNVERVNYGQGTVEKLFKFVNISRNIGIGLIIGLVFTAMFLISNTIKITIMARRREIEIMRLVGATNAFIRWPFFLEGLLLGVMGAVIPVVLILSGYSYIYDTFQPKLANTFVQLLPFNPFAYQVAFILVAIGAFIGVWGSLMSVRKFLKV